MKIDDCNSDDRRSGPVRGHLGCGGDGVGAAAYRADPGRSLDPGPRPGGHPAIPSNPQENEHTMNPLRLMHWLFPEVSAGLWVLLLDRLVREDRRPSGGYAPAIFFP